MATYSIHRDSGLVEFERTIDEQNQVDLKQQVLEQQKEIEELKKLIKKATSQK